MVISQEMLKTSILNVSLKINDLDLQLHLPDIGKTFGPLPDRRTGNHMENPSFTGSPKFLQDLSFC